MSTSIIPIHQAKSSLSQLVKRAAGGESIVIGRYGRAEAVLSSAARVKPTKRLGLLEGKLTVSEDFDAPLPPEILAAFEGDVQ